MSGKDLVTRKSNDGFYYNMLTDRLNYCLKSKKYPEMFNNYIYGKIDDKWVFRYPGYSTGYIQVDEDDIIVDIVVHEDTDEIYRKNVRKAMESFLGMRFVLLDDI